LQPTLSTKKFFNNDTTWLKPFRHRCIVIFKFFWVVYLGLWENLGGGVLYFRVLFHFYDPIFQSLLTFELIFCFGKIKHNR
jgi:hypothetical protein